MDTQVIKLDLLVWLANLQDTNLLLKLLEFRQSVEKKYSAPTLHVFTQEELIERAMASEHAIAAGETIEVGELAKEYGIQ